MSLEENRMSLEENKNLGRRIVDAINSGNLTAIDEVFASSYVDRTPFPGTTPDRDGFKQGLTKFRAAFPDFRYTIEDEIVSGDRLVHRLSGKGTQKGEFQGVPATGKQATWSEIHIGRLVNGKVVEHWGLEDQLGMMQQLGLVPATKVPAVR
jgi:predicted ester cyclase